MSLLGNKFLSLALFEILGTKQGHGLDLSGSRDVIGHVTIRLAIPHMAFPVGAKLQSSLHFSHFRDTGP